MLKIIKSEWIKIRKSSAWIPVLVGPILAICIGLLEVTNNHEFSQGMNHWDWMYPKMIAFYSLMFLPIVCGVIASLVCRFEHTNGGWKQLLTLPVSRSKIYFTKFIIICCLLILTQLLLLTGILSLGFFWHITDSIPWSMLLRSIVGGILAMLPLAAIQLWLSTIFKNFAVPFALNIILTIPNIILIYSDSFSPYYPWAQPFNAMMPSNYTPFYMAPTSLIYIVVLGTIVASVCGCIHFMKKDIYS